MNETTNTETYAWTWRTLTAEDIFPMVSLINKVGFQQFKGAFNSEDMQRMINGDNKDALAERVGFNAAFDIASIILSHLGDCEDDIFKMLAGYTTNMEEADVRDLPMNDFIDMITDFFKKPEFKDFTKAVSKLL